MAKQELTFTTRLTREDVAGIVEAMIEGLKEGLLKVQKSGESLELEVPRVVDLEVQASLSPERAVFDIEVSWRCNRPEIPDTPDNVPEDLAAKAPSPSPKPKKTASAKAAPKATSSGKTKAKS